MVEGGLRVNSPQVIHETIDGEVIVINLASGTYYSVKGAGAEVWDVIETSPGIDANAITAAVGRRFDRPSEEVEHEIVAFLEQLRQEDLVAPADNGAVTGSNGLAAGSSGKPYESPLLEKYTDMQDLVLLDPVHEVDATGWPHPKPAET
jgi:Coenzyme PQQ synthesis protein D (PqqD)